MALIPFCQWQNTNKNKFKAKGQLLQTPTRHTVTQSNKMESDNTKEDLVVTFNVGGTIFQCYSSTLQTFPESKLAILGQTNTLNSTNEYFFDRNPLFFGAILDAYRKREIHLPKDMCGTTFKDELEFWGVSAGHVAACCWETLYSTEGDTETMKTLMENCKKDTALTLMLKDKLSLRQRIWLILDEPSSSRLAFLWSVFISLLIVLSMLVTCMMTLPQFCDTYTDAEMDMLVRFIVIGGYSNGTEHIWRELKASDYLIYTDAVCHLILSLEIIVSFIVCNEKKKFMTCYLHLIVLLGYISFFITVVLDKNVQHITTPHAVRAYIVVRYLTILKIFRLFYITRHVPAFKIMRMTFRSSKQELKILAFMLSILVCLFGFFMYVAEFSFNVKMSNVLVSMYWALITLTTVGYGDYVPVTTAGHFVAAICAVCGVLVLALPIGVIASTFYTFYNYHKYARKHIVEYGTKPEFQSHFENDNTATPSKI